MESWNWPFFSTDQFFKRAKTALSLKIQPNLLHHRSQIVVRDAEDTLLWRPR